MLGIDFGYKTLWRKGYALDALHGDDKVLKIKPDYPEVWNNRGVVLANLGRYQKALQLKPDYKKASKLPYAWKAGAFK